MSPTSDSNSSESVSRGYTIADQEQPLVAIVEAVAAATGVEQQNLPPLESTINVDALTSLLESARSSAPDLKVEFHYNGCLVEVDRTEVIVRID